MSNKAKVITKEGALDAPFFLAPKAGAEDLEISVGSNKADESIFDGTPLCDTILEELYEGVPSENNGFETVGITFFSPNEIMKRDAFDGKFYDIGVQYRGMGYVLAFAFIPSTSMFFARMDGGSNDLDRELNFKKYSAASYQPSKFPTHTGELTMIKDEVQYTIDELRVLMEMEPMD